MPELDDNTVCTAVPSYGCIHATCNLLATVILHQYGGDTCFMQTVKRARAEQVPHTGSASWYEKAYVCSVSCLLVCITGSGTNSGSAGFATATLASASPYAAALADACSGALVLAGALPFSALVSHCTGRHKGLSPVVSASSTVYLESIGCI